MDQPHQHSRSSLKGHRPGDAMSTPHQHARPHIETHVRSKNHSAVAGAAYRLGLKLLDERTGAWHDFHRRSIRGEIALALTLAPEGSPDWATQPQVLWNRVEASEKRKDAQLARDYRIPVPLGLSSDQASVLAEQMARFISEALKTPVSVGVHRDSEVDVLGEKKASEKVGYHAHLYFPTRKLACFEEAGKGTVASGGVDGAGEATGFGSKLTILSNKNTSAAFVEMLNAKWAELSNELAGTNGLQAGYDHRSYIRQGVDLTSQPTVGQVATALERKGMETRRGNQLREAVKAAQQVLATTSEVPAMTVPTPPNPVEMVSVEALPSAPESSVLAPPDTPTPAVFVPPTPTVQVEPDFSTFGAGSNVVFLDKLRERRQQQGASGERSSGSGKRQSQAGQVVLLQRKERTNPSVATPIAPKPNPGARTSSKQPSPSKHPPSKGWLREVEDKPSIETLMRRHGLVLMKKDSIAAKLEKVLPHPLAPSEKERLKQSLVLVEFLQKILAALEAAKEDEEKKAAIYDRAKAAALDADYQIDRAREGRKAAQNRLTLWVRNRPMRYGLFGLVDSGKRKREELQADVRWKDELVQSAKRASERLHAFSGEALRALIRVQGLIVELKRDLAVVAVDLRSRNLRVLEEFSRWISMRERRLLSEALPGPTDSGLEVEGDVGAGADTGAGRGGTQKGVPPTDKPTPKVRPELGRLKR